MNSNYFDNLKNIRQYYEQKWNGSFRQDPYKFRGWFEMLTPIERETWGAIRAHGLEMYPQFPIGLYYADFAEPLTKTIFEIDGKVHQKIENKNRDKKRDAALHSWGWEVIRIEGWKCYRQLQEFENEDGTFSEDFENNSLYAHIIDLLQKKKQNTVVDNDERLVMSTDIKPIPVNHKANKVLFGVNYGYSNYYYNEKI
jgi:very-short-patch-repair endonuclease